MTFDQTDLSNNNDTSLVKRTTAVSTANNWNWRRTCLNIKNLKNELCWGGEKLQFEWSVSLIVTFDQTDLGPWFPCYPSAPHWRLSRLLSSFRVTAAFNLYLAFIIKLGTFNSSRIKVEISQSAGTEFITGHFFFLTLNLIELTINAGLLSSIFNMNFVEEVKSYILIGLFVGLRPSIKLIYCIKVNRKSSCPLSRDVQVANFRLHGEKIIGHLPLYYDLLILNLFNL